MGCEQGLCYSAHQACPEEAPGNTWHSPVPLYLSKEQLPAFLKPPSLPSLSQGQSDRGASLYFHEPGAGFSRSQRDTLHSFPREELGRGRAGTRLCQWAAHAAPGP